MNNNLPKNRMSRRQFLQGSGGFFLSLPFLPSLFVQELFAAEAALEASKCFFAMGTEHGGVRDFDLFGRKLSYASTAPASLSKHLFLPSGIDSGKTFSDHHFHYGNLTDYLETSAQAGDDEDPDNGNKRLSYILGNQFNGLLPKMNLLRGIDLHYHSTGHQTAVYLGNFGQTQNGPALTAVPTIDYLLANSNKFYKSLAGVTQKQGVLFTGKIISYGPPGVGQLPHLGEYSGSVFGNIFGSGTGGGGSAPTPEELQSKLVADKVYEDYQRFISPMSSTGRRIGKKDKEDLDRFLGTLQELQRKMVTRSSCPASKGPAVSRRIIYQWNQHPLVWEDLAQIVALAFACGACRIFTSSLDDRFLTRTSAYDADYHQSIAHNHRSSIGYHNHRVFHRIAANEAFHKVISTLDTFSGAVEGTTMLDQSLCTWQAESGIQTHNPVNNFAITAGSAGGFFDTGKFIDFRSLNNQCLTSDYIEMGGHPGISQNQYLANILMSMGLSPSDYENQQTFGGPGYGHWYVDPKTAANNGQIGFSSQHIAKSGNPIPIWVKNAA